MNMTGYVLFCYLLGDNYLGPRPQNKILVPFRGRFQKSDERLRHLYMGVPPLSEAMHFGAVVIKVGLNGSSMHSLHICRLELNIGVRYGQAAQLD